MYKIFKIKFILIIFLLNFANIAKSQIIKSIEVEGNKRISKETIILLSEHLKIIVEPGGAVAAAALLNKKINIKNKKDIVMISGGNIDLELFR